MNTQTAIRSPRASRLDDIVDSLAAKASDALANLDALHSQPKARPHIVSAASTTTDAPPAWFQPTLVESSSHLGKGGIFALVVLAHLLAFYVLSQLRPQVTHATAQPIEVVMLSAPVSNDVPPPPVEVPRMPTLDLPVVPVDIEIAAPEAVSIAVTSQPAEPAAAPSAAVGTPKTVSSVEYIREPTVKYPPAARALKQRGTVTLRALIDVNGTAREVNVLRSSNFRLLDDAARTAVLNALFKPYVENGHALPVYVLIPIEFGAAAT